MMHRFTLLLLIISIVFIDTSCAMQSNTGITVTCSKPFTSHKRTPSSLTSGTPRSSGTSSNGLTPQHKPSHDDSLGSTPPPMVLPTADVESDEDISDGCCNTSIEYQHFYLCCSQNCLQWLFIALQILSTNSCEACIKQLQELLKSKLSEATHLIEYQKIDLLMRALDNEATHLKDNETNERIRDAVLSFHYDYWFVDLPDYGFPKTLIATYNQITNNASTDQPNYRGHQALCYQKQADTLEVKIKPEEHDERDRQRRQHEDEIGREIAALASQQTYPTISTDDAFARLVREGVL